MVTAAQKAAKAKAAAAVEAAIAGKEAAAALKAKEDKACPEPLNKKPKTDETPEPSTRGNWVKDAGPAPIGGPGEAAQSSAMSTGAPASAPGEASTSVPGQRPAGPSSANLEGPLAWPRWEDPGDSNASTTDALRQMRSLVPWVRQELPAAMTRLGFKVDGDVAAMSPLKIEKESKTSKLSNFKETWTPANCASSIATTGLYEAGGSLFWLDPGFVGGHVPLLHQAPQWSVVAKYTQEFFSRTACGAAEEGESGLGRLLFPCVVEAYECDAGRDWSKMPRSLKLLAGQPMLFAWYLAAARALQRSDDALLTVLWQAALTCTVRVEATDSVAKLAVSAVAASEKYSRFADMADTFFHWTTKVQGILDDVDPSRKQSAPVLATKLADMGVRYRGALISKAHLYSVGHIRDFFDDSSLQVLRLIENEFGRHVLSTDYTKLSRFLASFRNHLAGVAAAGKGKEVL